MLTSKVESFWYSKTIFRWCLWPLSLPFLLITWLKRFLYRNKFLSSQQFEVPVIVVGNITLGGTGKTPFINFLAEQLKTHGYQVGIVSRGYLSDAETYPHTVSDRDTVETIGDEAFMQFANTKLPIVIGADRSQAIKQLTQQFKVDVVISDDGLQHYKMGRQYEILMVDSTRMFGNGLILPFGPLRESTQRTKSIDYIIQNGSGTSLNLKRYNNKSGVIELAVRSLVNISTGEYIPVEKISDIMGSSQAINAVCGIGNPGRFFKSLSLYTKNFRQQVFADHHAFEEKDFEPFAEQVVIMTEKDAVKCRQFARQNWYYLKVAVNMAEEDCQLLMTDIKTQLSGCGKLNK